MTQAEQISQAIATVERQISEAKSETAKKVLAKKLERLKEDLKKAKPSLTTLPKARKTVKALNKSAFQELVEELSKKPEYAFLKNYSQERFLRDKARTAKPKGYRFKGDNDNIPTADQVKKGLKNGTVYYEGRPIRSDISREIRLKTGGNLVKGYNNPEKATHVLNIDGFNWYLEKIDSTHFYMSNDPNSRGMAHHVDQHRGEPYYEEVRSWLKSTKFGKGGNIQFRKLAKSNNFDIIVSEGRFEVELDSNNKVKSIVHPSGERHKASECPIYQKYKKEINSYLTERFADGGNTESDATVVAKAIFYPNQKRGKIKTGFGDKTLEGLVAMIENDNYDKEEIANTIFASNEKNKKIETQWGDKTYGGLLAMISHARDNKLKNYNLGQFADGGGIDNKGVQKGYNVFNYTDNIYATDEVFKTKKSANDFIKEFRNRFSKQGYYRDNQMNKIDIEDIDLLAIPVDFSPFRKFAKGGGVNMSYAYGSHEYKNSFGIEQKDFIQMVDAYYNSYSENQYDRIESRMTFSEMRNKYGESKVDEIGEYLSENYKLKNKMAKGGKVGRYNVLSELLTSKAEGVKSISLNGFNESINYVIELNLDDSEIKKVGENSYITLYAKGGEVGDDETSTFVVMVHSELGDDQYTVEATDGVKAFQEARYLFKKENPQYRGNIDLSMLDKYAEGGNIDSSYLGTTRIGKGHYGWTAKTTTKKQINGYDWEITTMKRSSGDLVSSANGGKSEQKEGYSTFMYSPFEDPSLRLISSKPKMVNEKAVTKQHEEALKIFIEKLNEMKSDKMATGGKVGEKTYNVMHNVGKSKYVVNFHDGEKTHSDGSPFFDIEIFKNLKGLKAFTKKLESEGYKKQMKSGGELRLNEENYIMIYAKVLEYRTGLNSSTIEHFVYENHLNDDELLNILQGIETKKLSVNDLVSAVLLKKGNKKAKEIVSFAKSDKAFSKMATGGSLDKIKIGNDDFSFLLKLSDKELTQRLDLVRKQQSINGSQYMDARSKKEDTSKIEGAGERLAKQERAIIEARIRNNKMATGGSIKASDKKFKEVQDLGSEQYYTRYFGKFETEKGEIELMVVATIRDLEDYVSEDELPKEGNFQLSFDIVPKEEFISEDLLEQANDEDSSAVSDDSLVNIVNYMGGLRYEPSEKVHFKTQEKALKHLMSIPLNKEINKNGEYPDNVIYSYYNRAGSTNEMYLDYMIGVSDKFFKKGGNVGKSKKNKYLYIPNQDISKIVLKSKQVISKNRILDGAYVKGGKQTTKSVEKFSFPVGSVVWDKTHKRYGVVLNNFGNEFEGDGGEIRLDSDGVQPIFEYDKKYDRTEKYNLVPYGSKEDKGNGDLTDIKESGQRLIDGRKERGDEEYVKYYQDAFGDVIAGKIDGKPFKVNSEKVIGETSTGKSIYQKYTSMPDLSYEELKEASDIHKKFSKKAKTEEEKQTALKYSSEFMRMANEEKFAKGLGKFADGGNIDKDRLFNFLKDDLEKLKEAINDNDQEEIDKFFSYWNQHLKGLRSESNERMYNFLKDDLEELKEEIEENDQEDIDKFFSYWGQHLESVKYATGGNIDDSVEQLWRGYASAILFAETDYETEEPLDYNYSISDFDEETEKDSKSLLRKFYTENKKAIEESGLDLDTIGNDIWYTRAGHGAGFFDHSLDSDVEDALTNGAKALGEHPDVETYDGKISVRGGRVFEYKRGGKITKEDALQEAIAMGVDFNKEFHAQSFGNELTELAKKVGYRKAPSSSGSTGRAFFYHLQKIYDKKKFATGGSVSQYIDGMTEAEILKSTVVYDNGGETLDRYTVFAPDGSVYGMSDTASGFNQYVGDDSEIEKGSHLGKRLKTVPKGIKSAVLDRMKEEFADGGTMYADGGSVNGKYYTLWSDEEETIKTDFDKYEDALSDFKQFENSDQEIELYETVNGKAKLLKRNNPSNNITYLKLSNSDVVVEIEKRDGKWVEGSVLEGEKPYGWGGKTYMDYLKPNEVVTWINGDYKSDFQIIEQYAHGGSMYAGGGNTNYSYIEKDKIDRIVTNSGKEYGSNVILDGAYVTDRVRTPKMSRTQFEDETYSFGNGGNMQDFEPKSEDMRATILSIQRQRVNPSDVSPDYAKFVAEEIGRTITDKEAIRIAKGFGYEGKYATGGNINFEKHIWEGWTVGDFIQDLEPSFNQIMSGRSWQKPFTTKQQVKEWCMDNQPYYKKHVPEVVNYFWAKVEGKFATGGTVGDYFYDTRKDKAFQVIMEDGDKMAIQYLDRSKSPIGKAETISKNEFEYYVQMGAWNKWKQEFAHGGNLGRKGTYTGRIVTTESGDVMIGKISGYRGSGEPVYDVHKFGELRKDMREKVGELSNNQIKQLLKKYATGGEITPEEREQGLKNYPKLNF